MKFMIGRDELLKSLQRVMGVVERRQTLPILSHVLLTLRQHQLSVIGTDNEITLTAYIPLVASSDQEERESAEGEVTAPARKLLDICRHLPEATQLNCLREGNRLVLQTAQSRFSLATLPPEDFPRAELDAEAKVFTLPEQGLRALIQATSFAMAQQDVRYYLNGMLWELSEDAFRTVASDGHRMAVSTLVLETLHRLHVIVPRKTITELSRLLTDGPQPLSLGLSERQLQVTTPDYNLVSRLIDARFPDYQSLIPTEVEKILIIDRNAFQKSLARVAVLAGSQYRGVRLELQQDKTKKGQLMLFADNDDQESAEEQLSVNYQGLDLSIAFNIDYLLDALAALPEGLLKLSMSGREQGTRLEHTEKTDSLHVLMPMRL